MLSFGELLRIFIGILANTLLCLKGEFVGNQVVEFLEKQAKLANFQQFTSLFGSISISPNQIEQSSGSVYGIIAISEDGLNATLKPLPGFPTLYPIYWGKDISPVSRLSAHLQSYEGTGSAGLTSIDEVKGKKLIFGAILVSDYRGFEKHLHENFPPMKGSSRSGRGSTLVKIVN
jgi:hypothetical protein